MSPEEFQKLLGGNVGNAGKKNFFKPENHEDSYVMLIEPTKHDVARNPNAETDPSSKDYDEKKLTREEVTATVTVFASPEHLKAGEGQVLSNVVITQPFLAGDLKGSIGKLEIARLAKRPNGKGRRPSWVWRAAEGDVVAGVAAYYQKREADLQEALAGDDVPDYLRDIA